MFEQPHGVAPCEKHHPGTGSLNVHPPKPLPKDLPTTRVRLELSVPSGSSKFISKLSFSQAKVSENQVLMEMLSSSNKNQQTTFFVTKSKFELTHSIIM